ncbi:MAG: hypothetical protein JWN98_2662 [Abditibacteriota bacterium]|nr:hypothetical protein [Abditibacteriota bacterium]
MKVLSSPARLIYSALFLALLSLIALKMSNSVWRFPDIGLAEPSEHSVWPWPRARVDTPHRGVTHWLAVSRDGTICDLLRFDFKANPRLRFELYSQDEDDKQPFDNIVQFWPMGVGQATRHLNRRFARSGPVIAAWNGPFFGYHHVAPIPAETGFHLSPVVLNGRVYHNTANHRWSFGVKYFEGKPRFDVAHLPGRKLLAERFDFASGTVQLLLRNGRAFALAPFPTGPRDFKKQPVPSSPHEAGHIPYFDHAKFSRASIGWSDDHSRLFVLIVREPNGVSEGQSIAALSKWLPQSEGWNVPDLQRFWLSMARTGWIDHAINSDAGDVAQLTYRLPDGRYQMVSPIGDWPRFERRVFDADFHGAPQGGSVMYFYVREAVNPH